MAADGLREPLLRPLEDAAAAAAEPAAAEPAAKEEGNPVPVFSMLRFANSVDLVLLVIATLAAAVNACDNVLFSVVIGKIYDTLNGAQAADAKQISLVYLYIGVVLGITALLQMGLFELVAERMTVRLRRAYLEALLRQEIAFFDRPETAQLASVVSEATVQFKDALGSKLGSFLQFGGLFVVGLGAGFNAVWQLTLVILLVTPLLGYSGYAMMTAMQDATTSMIAAYARAGGIAEESFALIRTVVAFNLQSSRLAKYRAEVDSAAAIAGHKGRATGIGLGLTNLFFFLSFAVALYAGALLIARGRVAVLGQHPLADPPPHRFCAVGHVIPAECAPFQSTDGLFFNSDSDVCNCPACSCGCYFQGPDSSVSSSCLTGGQVILCLFSVLFGAFGLGQALPSISAFNTGRVAARRIYDILDRQPQITNDSTLTLSGVRGEIVFENVDFSYPSRPDAKVLINLNLSIVAGTRVGLVGESGSGKSTIIALLERFYDPTRGRVLLDGVDIRDFNLTWLRKHLGLVSQEPVLFATSVRENIRMGDLDASETEIEKACKDANAHSFIQEFPQGYDTFVGSAGSQLSGGQKQRLAIARALLRNPKVLLLDEATAALDNESERVVNEAIEKLLADGSGKRTSIVIAHRLSSIKSCDEIIVLDKGMVLEKGTHDSLMAQPGSMYSSMVKLSEGAQRESNTMESDARTKPGRSASLRSVDSTSSSKPDDLIEDQEKQKTTETGEEEKDVPMGRAWEFVQTDRCLLLPGVASALVNGTGLPLFAYGLSQLTATFYSVTEHQLKNSSLSWTLIFLAFAVVLGLTTFVQSYCFEVVNGRITARVRSALFEKLMSLDIGYFDDRSNSVGALTSKLSTDAALVKASIGDRLAVIFQNISCIVVGAGLSFSASWKLTLMISAMFPALAGASMIQMNIFMGMQSQDQVALGEAGQTLSDAVAGIRTVHAFNLGPHVGALYSKQLEGPMKRSTRKGFLAGAGFGLSQFIMYAAYGAAFYYGSWLVVHDGLSFANLNISLFGVMLTAMALGQIAASAPDIGKGQSAVTAIYRVLDQPSRINLDEGAKPDGIEGEIRFADVSFSYPTRKDVLALNHLNLTISPGSTVAFVGSSGSGKSSAVSLLLRFYDVDNGKVLLDGRDVRSISPIWIRSHIGVVSQEPALMDASILENIRSGRPEATDDECLEAAKMSDAYGFVRALPDQFNTMCGAKGSQLSGGQKQRIALARALVKKPAVLLLDEATSALDEESQRLVQESLDKLMAQGQQRRPTIVLVAHRLSTVRNADLICVFSQGSIIERGTFNELVAKPGGAFSSLMQAQTRRAS